MYYGIYLQYNNGNKFNGEDIFRAILKKITGQVVPVIIVENNHENKNNNPLNYFKKFRGFF